MKGYIAFVKKEFVENLKNYRFLILFAIFAIFGMSSAFLAKFTPEIIAAFGAGLEITEELKARDPMRWVGLMNTLKAQVEEMILNEIINE